MLRRVAGKLRVRAHEAYLYESRALHFAWANVLSPQTFRPSGRRTVAPPRVILRHYFMGSEGTIFLKR